MRTSTWMLCGALTIASPWVTAAELEGSATEAIPWARWQGRLSLALPAASPWQLGNESSAQKSRSASLMGDYYFSRSLVGPKQLGGFRATSGLIFGSRSAAVSSAPALAGGSGFNASSRKYAATGGAGDAPNDSSTLPYLGVGYTNLSVRSGWGFSADLGLLGQSAGSSVRFGRSFNASPSLDDAVRELRMTPLLQLGVSYAF
jgi:hypothetical protein